MNYENMSDFEINKAVAIKQGLKMCEGQHYQHCISHWVNGSLAMFNPCNSWADIGAVIAGKHIVVDFTGVAWRIDKYELHKDFTKCEGKPARAAAIVYLMMGDAE